MKRQHFVALIVVLGALLVAHVLIRQAGSRVATSAAEAGGAVLPARVDVAAITWIRLTPPAPAEGAAPVALSFEKHDGAWVVKPSGVPADGVAIEAFIAKSAALEGEVRGEGESSWASFGVTDAVALKSEMGSSAVPAATIFIGKAGDSGNAHFIRVAGAPGVRHVRDGLRQDLALWGSSAAPAADLWLKKDVIGLTGADVTRLVVERPGLRLVLEKQPAAPAPVTEPAPADAPAPAPPPPAAVWKVVEPELPWPHADGLAAVVERAATVRVAGAHDATDAACATDPVATVTFSRASGGDVVARLRGAIGEDAALTLDGAPHCWVMSSWSGTTLMPKASAIWDVPHALADLPASDPTRVRFELADGVVTATRGKDGKFTLAGARSGAADDARIARVISTLRSLRLDEIARVPAGAKSPSEAVTVDVGGRSVSVRTVGPPAGAFGERFAIVEGGKLPAGWALVLSRASREALFPHAEDVGAPAD